METIRDEFERSQNRSNERRSKTNKRRSFWTWFWVVLVLAAWIGAGLWALGIVHI